MAGLSKRNYTEEWSEEALEKFIDLINVLRKSEKEQKCMTEEEKKDNAIKMDGDIYY